MPASGGDVMKIGTLLVMCLVLVGCGARIDVQSAADYRTGGDFIASGDGRLVFWVKGPVSPVRLIGVRIPKPTSEYFMMSRNFFYRLVLKKRIRLEYDVRQIDGSALLAYVYVGDIMVNAEMIRRGYAFAHSMPPNIKCDAIFAGLEAEAKAEQRGFWRYIREEESPKGLF